MIDWNRRTAAHLYRRAGFGATPEELDRAVDEGLEATVDRLVDYEATDNSALESRLDFDLSEPIGLVQWWLTRMIFTARPLEERMTLFLHDHFATAISKVRDPAWMLQQNELLRRFALGSFTDLTIEISKDPAMLVWLDNYRSRKEHPNENYGRELLELFTLGHDAYTEDDVMAAARAFTGWTISRRTRQFVFADRFHDHGQKTFLGHTGDLDGGDIVRIACGTEAHAHFLAHKTFEYFAYADPEDAIIHELTHVYTHAGTSLKALVRAILLSPEMYGEKAILTKVKSPVEYVVSASRQLAIDRDVNRGVLAVLATQGQVPFNPPDVDGWPSGLAWVSSGTLLGRMNFAARATAAFDPVGFAGDEPIGAAGEMVDRWLDGLGPIDTDPQTRMRLEEYLAAGSGLSAATFVAKGQGLAHLVLSLPEWQLN